LPEAKLSSEQLKEYADFLNQNKPLNELGFSIDTQLLMHDIQQGLFFDSNIPQGYGVGSSGALIGALYDRYAKVDNDLLVRKQLAFLEHYFHGNSSGIDPLVAYLNKPLLINNDAFTIVNRPILEQRGVHRVLLLDTGQVGKTAPLVKSYFSKVENGVISPFEYVNDVNTAIDILNDQSSEDFLNYVYRISEWQYNNLQEMIPNSIKEFWLNGLKNQNWLLKLCGSGGGGFFYIFVLKETEFQMILRKKEFAILKF
jgi:mevalonate kinase